MNNNLMDNQIDDEDYFSKTSSITNFSSSKRKKFPAKQIHNVWLSLKKFNQASLDKIRNSPKLKQKRFKLQTEKCNKNDTRNKFLLKDHRLYRLTSSHPELSYSNIAQLSNYQSFDDLITINSKDYLPKDVDENFYSNSICQNDKNMERNLNKSLILESNCSTFLNQGKNLETRNKILISEKSIDSVSKILSNEKQLNKDDEISKQTPILSKKPTLNFMNDFEKNEDNNSLNSIDTNDNQSNLIRNFDRRNSFLKNLLLKKSIDKSLSDKTNSNYEYYNQSIDEDYEKSLTYNDKDQGFRNLIENDENFFLLNVHLKCCRNLLAKDFGGTSDPYVKFKTGNKLLFKSKTIYKNLNPVFDEIFTLPIENILEPLLIDVYDYDMCFKDDYLGSTQIDLTKLINHKPEDLILKLSENGKKLEPEENWGQIELKVTLSPKSNLEKEQFYHHKYRSSIEIKRIKVQEWDSVVNIVLVEGRNLFSRDGHNLTDAYVRFKLDNEKYKSKTVSKNSNPSWNEQFDLYSFPNQKNNLEIFVYNKDELIGKNVLNISSLKKEETHEMVLKLEGCINGELFILITISGIKKVENLNDINFDNLARQYSLSKSFQNFSDVGKLVVQVLKAEDLSVSDLIGKSDPFCVLELVNNRVQTTTEYKTLNPIWNKTFILNVKDIHESLKIIIFDEDQDKKFDFLGQVIIPILSIKNNQKEWYQLKDKTLLKPTKGRILLNFILYFNPIKAAWKTVNPKDKKILKQEKKLKRIVFQYNINRLKTILVKLYMIIGYINSCFEWENKLRSFTAMILFCLTTYFFHPVLIPLFFLSIFLINFIKSCFTSQNHLSKELDFNQIESLDESFDDEDEEKIEKKTFKEKINSLQESFAQTQNIIGDIASLGERIINVFNYKVPFLSIMAIIAIFILVIVLYFIRIRYLVLILGLNKFTKKLRSPNSQSNNEILDFLSRVPDKKDLITQRELPIIDRNVLKNKKKKN